MSDIAVYPLEDGYVLRVHGTENLLTSQELGLLADFLNSILDTGEARYGSEYSELCFDAAQRRLNKQLKAKPDLSRLFAHLEPKAPFKRRF